MKQYNVTIRAIVTKTYVIEAEDEYNAVITGQEIFSVLDDGSDENYEQDILTVKEVE